MASKRQSDAAWWLLTRLAALCLLVGAGLGWVVAKLLSAQCGNDNGPTQNYVRPKS